MKQFKLRDLIDTNHPHGTRNRLVQHIAVTILDTIDTVTMPAMVQESFAAMGFSAGSDPDSELNTAARRFLNGEMGLSGGMDDSGVAPCPRIGAPTLFHDAIQQGCYQGCLEFLNQGKSGTLKGSAGRFYGMYAEQCTHNAHNRKILKGGIGGIGSVQDAIVRGYNDNPTRMEQTVQQHLDAFKHRRALQPLTLPSYFHSLSGPQPRPRSPPPPAEVVSGPPAEAVPRPPPPVDDTAPATPPAPDYQSDIRLLQNQLSEQRQQAHRAEQQQLQNSQQQIQQNQEQLQRLKAQYEQRLASLQQQVVSEKQRVQQVQQSVADQVQQNTADERALLQESVAELKASEEETDRERDRFQEELSNTKERVKDIQAKMMSNISQAIQQRTRLRFSSAFKKIYENAKASDAVAQRVAARPTLNEILNGGLSKLGDWMSNTVFLTSSIFKHLASDYDVWLQQIPNAKALSRLVHILYTQVWTVVKGMFFPSKQAAKQSGRKNSGRRKRQADVLDSANFSMTPETARKVRMSGRQLNREMADILSGGRATGSLSGGLSAAKSLLQKALGLISEKMGVLLGSMGKLIKYIAGIMAVSFAFRSQLKAFLQIFSPIKKWLGWEETEEANKKNSMHKKNSSNLTFKKVIKKVKKIREDSKNYNAGKNDQSNAGSSNVDPSKAGSLNNSQKDNYEASKSKNSDSQSDYAKKSFVPAWVKKDMNYKVNAYLKMPEEVAESRYLEELRPIQTMSEK